MSFYRVSKTDVIMVITKPQAGFLLPKLPNF